MKPANLILGFMVGAITGTALGLLFAPDKGERTRRKVIYVAKKNNKAIKSKINHYKEVIEAHKHPELANQANAVD